MSPAFLGVSPLQGKCISIHPRTPVSAPHVPCVKLPEDMRLGRTSVLACNQHQCWGIFQISLV